MNLHKLSLGKIWLHDFQGEKSKKRKALGSSTTRGYDFIQRGLEVTCYCIGVNFTL